MNAVWKHSRAEERVKLTLLAIADHQGEQGAWPSISTLAKMVGTSERSIKRDIAALKDLGELIVVPQGAPVDNQYKPNLYFVNLTGVTGAHPSKPSGVTEVVSRGDTRGKSGVTGSGTQNIKRNIIKHGEFNPSQDFLNQLEEQFPGVDLRANLEAFNDWVKAKGASYKDWNAAFRNWVRKDFKWNPPTTQQLDKSRDWTTNYIKEQEELAKQAVPPPKCKHAKSLALCPICVRG
jgi:hypothetical protein